MEPLTATGAAVAPSALVQHRSHSKAYFPNTREEHRDVYSHGMLNYELG